MKLVRVSYGFMLGWTNLPLVSKPFQHIFATHPPKKFTDYNKHYLFNQKTNKPSNQKNASDEGDWRKIFVDSEDICRLLVQV